MIFRLDALTEIVKPHLTCKDKVAIADRPTGEMSKVIPLGTDQDILGGVFAVRLVLKVESAGGLKVLQSKAGKCKNIYGVNKILK